MAFNFSNCKSLKLAIIKTGPNGETEFCCNECPMKYNDKETLELHLCMHNREYRFICSICGTGLKRREHLDRHMLEHKNVRPYICPICGRGFKRKEHLNIHKTLHSGVKKEICPVCQRSFHRKDHLKKHMQVHTKHELATKIATDPDIKIEVEDMPIKIEPFETDMISAIDEDVDQMNNSRKDIMESMDFNAWVNDEVLSEKPFSCSICYKKFKRKNHLALHNIVHEKKDKCCTICGKAYHKEEQLQYHMLSHRGVSLDVDQESSNLQIVEDQNLESNLLVGRVKSRPYVCHVCQKRFKSVHKLEIHSKTHANEEDIAYVDEDKSSYEDFGNHYILSGSTQEENNSQIQSSDDQQDCQDPLATENIVDMEDQNLFEPQTIMFVDNNHIPRPQKVFVCKVCSKPFKRKDHYKIHLHIHTGIKTVFCPECGRGFYRKDHLKKHFTVHRRISQPFTDNVPLLPPPKPVTQKTKFSPEITIRAPSNIKLRSPLKINVPYEVVVASEKDGGWDSYFVSPEGTGTVIGTLTSRSFRR